MLIILFFLSCIVAIYFTVMLEKAPKKWIKNSFALYGIVFAITAVSLGAIYINEHKVTLMAFAEEFVDTNSIGGKQASPTRPMTSEFSIIGSVQLDAPLIKQMPELPRGCEVTSLAMLLNYNDIEVDKMELAKKVSRDPTPYQVSKEGVQFGNPHKGFVGDMYDFKNPGLGVYHGPIAELAKQYVDESHVHDLTGKGFSEVFNQLAHNRPVWVIINTSYNRLPESKFTTWQTPDGPQKVTMKEHSVLITGYDNEYIYFNDPLNKNTQAPIEEFEAAWVQMGKQAITIY
ncbi:C39 family peptidase [Virgibacillus byunsanensis]|uniref:C39 family peptidase n=1 Tax=Virgibacillus byunsanensis TaxID=570945 RepID=A0ABW3LP27_9BACI